jgi:cytochrome c peroxidase
MAVRFSRDGKRVYVANYLLNAVQVVDPLERKIVESLPLGGPTLPSLARRGEAIFHDGKRSIDQWYSCHSCHYEGGANAVTMDTRNDGRFGNFKTVLGLREVRQTGPWFWHGNEKDFDQALRRSMTGTLLGKEPSGDDVRALAAFLDTLEYPAAPRPRDDRQAEAVRRGEGVFAGRKAGCARCHPEPTFTDGRIHEVGTGERGDVYRGYNPPSLRGVRSRVLFLHDGRVQSLEELLRGPHDPDKLVGRGKLTDGELRDLIAYLRSL